MASGKANWVGTATTAPEQSPISVSTRVMPALGRCWASAISRRDCEPHQSDGMGQGWGWLLGRHKCGLMQRDSCNGMRGTTKAGAVCMRSSTVAKRCGMEKLMSSVGSKVFLSWKAALGWSEAQPCARNGFGHFSSAVALSPAPSTSSAVTTQSPVLGGDEPQRLPVLAQLDVPDLCATSSSRAGSLLFPCPQDGYISPLPLRKGMSKRTCL